MEEALKEQASRETSEEVVVLVDKYLLSVEASNSSKEVTLAAVVEEDVVASVVPVEAVEDLAVAQEEAEEEAMVVAEVAKAAAKTTLALMRISSSTGTKQVSRTSVKRYLSFICGLCVGEDEKKRQKELLDKELEDYNKQAAAGNVIPAAAGAPVQ